MIAEALVSVLGGGLLRAVPEVLSFFDKKNERAHELSMCDKQLALEQQKASGALALASEQHESSVDTGLIQALVEAQKGQAQTTGIRFVDALNALVRPTIAYAIFGLYALVRIATLIVAIKTNPSAWQSIIVSCWTNDDMSMLNTVLGFFFVSRAFLGKK